MSRVRCPHCHYLQPLVPRISDDEIGLVPQYLADHRQGGRAFAGPRCAGSHMPYGQAVRAATA